MFRRLMIAPVLVLGLLVGGCGSGGTNLGDLLQMATTPIANPVSAREIYAAKLTLAEGEELAVQWRRKCFSAPYATLMANPATKFACENRRARTRAIKSAKDTAVATINNAANFVHDNPTLDAGDVITLMKNAVTGLKNVIPALN